jgi:hypothetical protein
VESVCGSRQHDVGVTPLGHQSRQKIHRQKWQIARQDERARRARRINCRVKTTKSPGPFHAVGDHGHAMSGVPRVIGHNQNALNEGTEESKLPLENSRGTNLKGGFVAASKAPRASAREDSRAPHAAITVVLKGS